MLGQASFLCGLVSAVLGVTPLAKDEPKVTWPKPSVLASTTSGHATLAAATDKRQEATTAIACDHAEFGLAPYVWKRTGAGRTARAEATMPGAYFKAVFRDSKTVGLIVDGTANNGCPVSSMPVVEFCVDDGPIKIVALARTEAAARRSHRKGWRHAQPRIARASMRLFAKPFFGGPVGAFGILGS